MKISIEIINGKIVITNDFIKELNLNENEQLLVSNIIDMLSDSVDSSKLHVERRSDSYATLVYGEYNDFLRFKFTERTKWISICMPHHLLKKHETDPRFSAQKNKNQLHWKAKISSLSDIQDFKDLMIQSCIYFADE